MDYSTPTEVVSQLVDAGARKATISVRDLLLRGALSGALLAVSTTLAITATAQSGAPIIGALIFPVGFVMIVLLGLELVTGSFALLPMAQMARRTNFGGVLRNWIWVFAGNLIGSVIYGILFAATLTMMFSEPATGIASKIVGLAEAKTLGYAAHGGSGFITAFIKAMLCNWLVCMGVVMATVARSTVSKVLAAWLPVATFFALGFEHTVVNMFLIPTGMMLGAKTTVADWVLWNMVPVTLGNLVGGFVFTGLALYSTYALRSGAGREAAAGAALGTSSAAPH